MQFVLLGYAHGVEEWKYQMLAEIKRIANVHDGFWDPGVDKSLLSGESRGQARLEDRKRIFLEGRDELFRANRTAFALYLSKFRFEDVQSLWIRLVAEAARDGSVDKLSTVRLGPKPDDPTISVSIGLLFAAAALDDK